MTAVRTMFLISKAATRHMVRQGSGVILVFGGYGDPLRDYYLRGLQVAFQATESLRRQFPSELGRYGVRVVTLQTGGITEMIPESFAGREAIVEVHARRGRPASLREPQPEAAVLRSVAALQAPRLSRPNLPHEGSGRLA